ncbi:MAG TPA: phosphoglycerate mutase family protein [Pyrinomonadaceae bacterium]|nr:phosphoglycerate mutase family protein [Pyrinomonadaceae bacterium]
MKSPTFNLLLRYAFVSLFIVGVSLMAPSKLLAQTPQPPLTVILARHAEKEVVPPENKDPNLSMAGQTRAQELARMFGGAGVTSIYATQFKRTQQTVKPLADKLGLTATIVEAQKTPDLVKLLRASKPGEVVFLAGHNNSVPEIIAALGGPKMPIIPETEYDNLFILTVQGDGSAKLLKMKYGSPLPSSGAGMERP